MSRVAGPGEAVLVVRHVAPNSPDDCCCCYYYFYYCYADNNDDDSSNSNKDFYCYYYYYALHTQRTRTQQPNALALADV